MATKQKRSKIVLLGEPSVGKSSIARRLVKNEYSDNYESTIGAAYFTLKFNDIYNNEILFDVWDTAGQERYMSLSPMYYRNANVALLVFDCTNFEGLDRLVTYLEYFVKENMQNISCIIIGNKTDLVDKYQLEKKMHIITDKFEQFNQNFKVKLEYIFVSAKNNQGIKELKDTIIKSYNEINKDVMDSIQLMSDESKPTSNCTC